jgi:8-oxo-dGTP pyrophosphatase MutT (NUDIX family)
MKTEKSCGAIVFRREGNEIKFLLLHYGAGHWEFPRGHPEKGEDEKETALRELGEETGIKKADFVKGFKKEISFYFRKEKELILKTAVFYLLETKQRKIKLSREHMGYRWAGLGAALKILTFKDSRKVLEAAHDFLMKIRKL